MNVWWPYADDNWNKYLVLLTPRTSVPETNRTQLFPFGMQKRTLGPYLAAKCRILISVMNSWQARAPEQDAVAVLARGSSGRGRGMVPEQPHSRLRAVLQDHVRPEPQRPGGLHRRVGHRPDH
jgi:hypothetical protein